MVELGKLLDLFMVYYNSSTGQNERTLDREDMITKLKDLQARVCSVDVSGGGNKQLRAYIRKHMIDDIISLRKYIEPSQVKQASNQK